MKFYDTRQTPAQVREVESEVIQVHLNVSIQRFWESERRLPAAIVMPTQVAREFMGTTGTPWVGALTFYGLYAFSEYERLPVLGRDAYLDPMWQCI